MKKILALLLTVFMCVSFSGCESKTGNSNIEYFAENGKAPVPSNDWEFIEMVPITFSNLYRYDLGSDKEEAKKLIKEYHDLVESCDGLYITTSRFLDEIPNSYRDDLVWIQVYEIEDKVLGDQVMEFTAVELADNTYTAFVSVMK